MSTLRPQSVVKRLLLVQIALSVLLALFFLVFFDVKAAYSALTAGIICMIANSYFAWRVLKIQGARQAKQFLMAFCFGELMKLVILSALFVLAVLFLHIEIGPFLVSFVVNLMIFWIAPFLRWEA